MFSQVSVCPRGGVEGGWGMYLSLGGRMSRRVSMSWGGGTTPCSWRGSVPPRLPPPHPISQDTVGKRAAGILLECFFVLFTPGLTTGYVK